LTVRVSLVVPDRELWAGEARTVIAKTTEGDIGILAGHSPVFGILAEGSLVEILDAPDLEGPLFAAVSGGFLSVASDRVSILAAQAELGSDVDTALVRQDLEAASSDSRGPGSSGSGSGSGGESAEAKYARAQLRAAGDQA
jgi:F-type H+-transporting ATPase subunit epsilon